MEADRSKSSLGALVARLGAIGLDEKDALLYLHLCAQGPTKASEAAAAAKLNRTEAYRALDDLMRRGFVTASLDRPTLYEATPPEKVFDDALAAHVARRVTIERARESTLSELTEMCKRQPGAPLTSSYKLLQGRAAIYVAAESMVRRARHSQILASTYLGPQVATEANAPYVTMLQRAKEGLDIKILLRTAPEIGDSIRGLTANKNVCVRTFEPPHPIRFTIVDDREILIWLVTDASPSLTARDDVAMWTNASDFVKAHLSLYDALWATGRDI